MTSAQPVLDKAPMTPAPPPAPAQIIRIKIYASRFKCAREIAPARRIKPQQFNALRSAESNRKPPHLRFRYTSILAPCAKPSRNRKCTPRPPGCGNSPIPKIAPTRRAKSRSSSQFFPQLPAETQKTIFPQNSRSFPAQRPPKHGWSLPSLRNRVATPSPSTLRPLFRPPCFPPVPTLLSPKNTFHPVLAALTGWPARGPPGSE